eukprot:1457194-Rhodomonas_salina.1
MSSTDIRSCAISLRCAAPCPVVRYCAMHDIAVLTQGMVRPESGTMCGTEIGYRATYFLRHIQY